MKIEEAIQSIRSYCSDIDAFTGKPIDPKTTRDQVLYGERSSAQSALASSPASGPQQTSSSVPRA